MDLVRKSPGFTISFMNINNIIAVFNSDLLGVSERRKAVIPNVGLPTQTPVVALYRKGQLIESAEGYVACQALVLAQCKAV